MLIAAVIVYPIDIPTRFEYWDTAQSLYLIPPGERERERERISLEDIYDRKFLSTSRVWRNCTPSSHIHGGSYHKFNE